MSQTKFNIYFILSFVWFGSMFITGLFDESRIYIDNTVYLIILLLSLFNMAYAVYLFNQPINNYYQDEENRN